MQTRLIMRTMDLRVCVCCWKRDTQWICSLPGWWECHEKCELGQGSGQCKAVKEILLKVDHKYRMWTHTFHHFKALPSVHGLSPTEECLNFRYSPAKRWCNNLDGIHEDWQPRFSNLGSSCVGDWPVFFVDLIEMFKKYVYGHAMRSTGPILICLRSS